MSQAGSYANVPGQMESDGVTSSHYANEQTLVKDNKINANQPESGGNNYINSVLIVDNGDGNVNQGTNYVNSDLEEADEGMGMKIRDDKLNAIDYENTASWNKGGSSGIIISIYNRLMHA